MKGVTLNTKQTRVKLSIEHFTKIMIKRTQHKKWKVNILMMVWSQFDPDMDSCSDCMVIGSKGV